VVPPAGNGTIRFTGLVGQAWATAAPAASAVAATVVRIKEFSTKAARQLGKDYLVFPALTALSPGAGFTSTLKANLLANVIRNLWTNAVIFCGHFPDEPVMPGVLQVEAMAQIGGLMVLNSVENPSSYSTYFLKIDNVKFRQKVVPGDTLIFRLDMISPMRRGCALMKGYAFVGEKIVSEAEFMAQIIKNK
jgi:3-hydroxymyristoyl/3-hydroxydecanoyl-(acyl carrier protein) dehydratase